jgi:hypothetical protein
MYCCVVDADLPVHTGYAPVLPDLQVSDDTGLVGVLVGSAPKRDRHVFLMHSHARDSTPYRVFVCKAPINFIFFWVFAVVVVVLCDDTGW